MVAALAVGAIGAVGSVVAGSEAAGATKDATNASIAQQQSALQQQSQLSQPYRDLGQSAIPQLQSLLGIAQPGKSAQDTSAAQQQTLQNTPGYQFQQQQGQQNTVNAATAQGLSLSGNTLEGLSKFNQGLADTTYQQAVGNLQNTVSQGQAAAAGQASNVGNAASNISNSLTNQGNTLAGIDANEAAGITKSLGNAANTYETNQTLKGLQNPGGSPGSPAAPGSDLNYSFDTNYSGGFNAGEPVQ